MNTGFGVGDFFKILALINLLPNNNLPFVLFLLQNIVMFSFLKKDPIKDLTNKRKKLLEEAMHIQRSGDLKLYAVKMEAIDKLEKELDALQSGNR